MISLWSKGQEISPDSAQGCEFVTMFLAVGAFYRVIQLDSLRPNSMSNSVGPLCNLPDQTQGNVVLTHQTRLRVCSAACSAPASSADPVEGGVGGGPVAVEVVRLLAAHPARSARRRRRVLRGGRRRIEPGRVCGMKGT